VSIPLLAGAAGNRNESGRISTQIIVAHTSGITTRSKDWKDIPSLEIMVCQKGPVSESVSTEVSGGPVMVRIVEGSHGGGTETPLVPGSARFVPTSGRTSVESTFAFGGGGGGEDIHGFHVQWRSPSGATIEMRHILTRLLYKRPNKLCA
jgi:hypothetical protein